jgi:hypothetical protein
VTDFIGDLLESVAGPKRAPSPNTLQVTTPLRSPIYVETKLDQTFNQTVATSTHGLYDRPGGLAATDTTVMVNEDSPKPLSGGFKPV